MKLINNHYLYLTIISQSQPPMKNNYKLHYCTDSPIQYRYRKIKSVINALGIDVTDSPK
jgi:hypothetical protein